MGAGQDVGLYLEGRTGGLQKLLWWIGYFRRRSEVKKAWMREESPQR